MTDPELDELRRALVRLDRKLAEAEALAPGWQAQGRDADLVLRELRLLREEASRLRALVVPRLPRLGGGS